jgi:hypothetical protein
VDYNCPHYISSEKKWNFFLFFMMCLIIIIEKVKKSFILKWFTLRSGGPVDPILERHSPQWRRCGCRRHSEIAVGSHPITSHKIQFNSKKAQKSNQYKIDGTCLKMYRMFIYTTTHKRRLIERRREYIRPPTGSIRLKFLYNNKCWICERSIRLNQLYRAGVTTTFPIYPRCCVYTSTSIERE